jgi:hypothetical protein
VQGFLSYEASAECTSVRYKQSLGLTTLNMTERRNTILCAFDPNSPKISSFDIHEWIYETLRLPDQEVNMIQIEGIKRHVYIKLETEQYAHRII